MLFLLLGFLDDLLDSDGGEEYGILSFDHFSYVHNIGMFSPPFGFLLETNIHDDEISQQHELFIFYYM